MQPWLLLFVDNDHRLRWRHRQLRPLWIWLQLRREWRPGSRMHVFSWVRLDCDELESLRHNNVHVLDDRLRRGSSVRGRGSSAGRLYLQPGLRVHVNHDIRLCDIYWNVLDEWLRRGQRVCWRNSAACHLQLQPWLLLFVDNHHRLHGNHELLHRVWRRLQLRW